MIELIIFILASVGMSHILVEGEIFNNFKTLLKRELNNEKIVTFRQWIVENTKYVLSFPPLSWICDFVLGVMGCHLCSGFWSGGFIGLIMGYQGLDPLHSLTFLSLFVYACVAAICSYWTVFVFVWLQK